MASKLSFFLLLALLLASPAASENTTIIYNGFRTANLTLDGIATLMPNGLLRLTNDTKQEKAHAFHPDPIRFKKSPNGTVYSFSTTFVFAIISQIPGLSGHGIAFVITPTRGLPYSLPSQYLGLFNKTNNGNTTNHVVAVELDTILSSEFQDINDNHVGIDLNSLQSTVSAPAGYHTNASSSVNVSLYSGKPMQIWIEYDGPTQQMNVTLGLLNKEKPSLPLLNLTTDLSSILNETMYIGFSSSTGSVLTSHYILGWSFAPNTATAPSLDIPNLPKLPKIKHSHTSKILMITLPLTIALIIVLSYYGYTHTIQRKKKFAEEVEDWESQYGPQRYKYKDLYDATKGFRDSQLLGSGGFGRVYKGVHPKTKLEIAVKKVSHESRQGVKEFVAEIASMGRLRHRNLVQLLGYCRRRGELLLVYDFMPNGSLDRFIHPNNNVSTTLTWSQRFKIIKGVASGLMYLHEGWEQVVVHRDIKASNVLLDGEMNGRLGDFGLARLYDHGTDPQTTHVVGTLGYLAPEHTRTGKATRGSDVFAFGAFLLEVVCGRRPIDLRASAEEMVLVDWVYGRWKRGEVLSVVDRRLGGEYVEEEVDLVVKLGLMCSSVEAEERPWMREVVAYLDGVGGVVDLAGLEMGSGGVYFSGGRRRGEVVAGWTSGREGFSEFAMESYPSTTSYDRTFTRTGSAAESQLSEGR